MFNNFFKTFINFINFPKRRRLKKQAERNERAEQEMRALLTYSLSRREGDEKADDTVFSIDEKNSYRHYSPTKTDKHDLKKMVVDVDLKYLDGFFAKDGSYPRISWWIRGAKNNSNHAVGGLAFPWHSEILINVRFNSKEASKAIVELLVYHELIHIYLHRIGKNSGHTREFYAIEGRYKDFTKAKDLKNKYYKSHVIGVPLSEVQYKKTKRVYTAKRFEVSVDKRAS